MTESHSANRNQMTSEIHAMQNIITLMNLKFTTNRSNSVNARNKIRGGIARKKPGVCSGNTTSYPNTTDHTTTKTTTMMTVTTTDFLQSHDHN